MICYMGIDPGEKDGAVAIETPSAEAIAIFNCPPTLVEMNQILCDLIETHGKDNIRVAIEKGVTQVRFPIGERDKKGRMKTKVYQCPVLWGNYQAWCALLTAHKIKYTPVPARRWQTAICDGKRKLSTKDRAWETANRLYPQLVPLFKGPKGAKKYGRSDAACILEWCKRNL